MVSIGQRLASIRLKKKLSLDDVAKDLKINPRFLNAIENGEYNKLPSPAYAQGFITNYAGYLGFSRRETLAFFRREFDEKAAYKVLPESLTKSRKFPRHHLRIRQSLILVSLFLCVIGGYLLFQFISFYLPPALAVASPEENATVSSSKIIVKGNTSPEATVLINGELTSLDSKGEFSKQITAFPGQIMVTITAKNRLGKETKVTRSILVK